MVNRGVLYFNCVSHEACRVDTVCGGPFATKPVSCDESAE